VRPMYGTTHSKNLPAGCRAITKFIARTRSCRCKPPLAGAGGCSAAARDAGGARATGLAPRARRLRRFIQLSKIRGAANGEVETSRGRENSAQESNVRLAGVSPQTAHPGEVRAPKSIVQEGKKGIRGLISVFMEIQPAPGFSERLWRGETCEVPVSLPE